MEVEENNELDYDEEETKCKLKIKIKAQPRCICNIKTGELGPVGGVRPNMLLKNDLLYKERVGYKNLQFIDMLNMFKDKGNVVILEYGMNISNDQKNTLAKD